MNSKKVKCEFCGKSFQIQGYHRHRSACSENPNPEDPKRKRVLKAFCIPSTVNEVVQVLNDKTHYNYQIVHQYKEQFLKEGKLIKLNPEKKRNIQYINVELWILHGIAGFLKDFNTTLQNLEKEEINLQKRHIEIKTTMLQLQKFITNLVNLSNAPNYDLAERIKSLSPDMENALKLINLRYEKEGRYEMFI